MNGFVSADRTHLSHVLCLVSTPSVGYLYCIGASFQLVATYHYATVVSQVLLLPAHQSANVSSALGAGFSGIFGAKLCKIVNLHFCYFFFYFFLCQRR